MVYEKQVFKDQIVNLADSTFVDCRFEKCELVLYEKENGEKTLVKVQGCHVVDCLIKGNGWPQTILDAICQETTDLIQIDYTFNKDGEILRKWIL